MITEEGPIAMRHLPVLLLALLLSVTSRAQSDSLWAIWNDADRSDSIRLEAMQSLAWKAVFERPDSGMALADRQLALAVSVGSDKARYGAYTTLAVGSSMKSDYVSALAYLQQCVSVARRMADPKREANTYSNLSNVYRNLGDLPQALECLQKSLAIDGGLGNTEGLAGTYNNIGNIHTELEDLPKALENYARSAALYQELDHSKGKAQALMNLGATHLEMGERTTAMEEFLHSLQLYRGMGRKLEMGMAFNNLGRTYGELGREREAFAALDSAFSLFDALGSGRQIARNLFYRGNLLLKQGNARKAKEACAEGLKLARDLGLAQQRKECSQCLVEAYEALGDLGNAFRAQKEFMQVSDSLDQLNNAKEVQRLDLLRQFQQQQIADSLETVRARYEQELAYQLSLEKERDRRNLLLLSGAGLLVLAGGLWNRLRFTRRSRAALQKEKQRSDDLLHNILPQEVAAELKTKGHAEAKQFERVTIVFTDFKGFTQVSETLTPSELVSELNACFKAFDAIVDRHGVEKIKTIGDAYMAAGGIPEPSDKAVRNAVMAALDMQAFMRERLTERNARGLPAFEMRVGLHTGPVVAGIVGSRKFQYDIWGDAVNTAARMESSGEVGQVNISAVTYELLQHDPAFRFTPRGKVEAKGKGAMEMYFVARADV